MGTYCFRACSKLCFGYQRIFRLFCLSCYFLVNEEAIPEFCYLGDMLSAGGGCALAVVTRCKFAWGKFHQLLPLLINSNLPLLTRGWVYSTCMRSVMMHAAETLATITLNRLRRNDSAMICNVKAKDEVSSDSLLSQSLASRTWMWCSASVG